MGSGLPRVILREIDLSQYVKKSELESLINSMLGGTSNEQAVSGNNASTKAVITE